ncbi:dihydroxyacetone kinase subunit L [Mycolicibacterium septicum DSM 44393]|uniref:Dihydroxyacetone kinase subunit L n=1 Tax=Mycolicibacterium septicum DSM 44393 TaxID=1341646 RepID=A0A7X6MLI0_9MYCO|nr:dihydroxyacetone kinase subunit DhaL [Mycolicibacterium septicum]NKZ10790.1 dihydroxyacetone kinase subunit L [Mycolicibacterium septicum DSM 44393]
MSTAGSVGIAEVVVRAIADTAIENEEYFCDLDAVAGDGDFGYSLARGFEVVVAEWDAIDRTSVAAFLRRVSVIITSRTGGTSGPIWGTGFLRAAASLDQNSADDANCTVVALRAAVLGIMARGNADLGDKTLLDALVPAIDVFEERVESGDSPRDAAFAAAAAARIAADGTKNLVAKRGRASYTGSRSLGAPDPGAVAIAAMVDAIAGRLWNSDPTSTATRT